MRISEVLNVRPLQLWKPHRPNSRMSRLQMLKMVNLPSQSKSLCVVDRSSNERSKQVKKNNKPSLLTKKSGKSPYFVQLLRQQLVVSKLWLAHHNLSTRTQLHTRRSASTRCLTKTARNKRSTHRRLSQLSKIASRAIMVPSLPMDRPAAVKLTQWSAACSKVTRKVSCQTCSTTSLISWTHQWWDSKAKELRTSYKYSSGVSLSRYITRRSETCFVSTCHAFKIVCINSYFYELASDVIKKRLEIKETKEGVKVQDCQVRICNNVHELIKALD